MRRRGHRREARDRSAFGTEWSQLSGVRGVRVQRARSQCSVTATRARHRNQAKLCSSQGFHVHPLVSSRAFAQYTSNNRRHSPALVVGPAQVRVDGAGALEPRAYHALGGCAPTLKRETQQGVAWDSSQSKVFSGYGTEQNLHVVIQLGDKAAAVKKH